MAGLVRFGRSLQRDWQWAWSLRCQLAATHFAPVQLCASSALPPIVHPPSPWPCSRSALPSPSQERAQSLFGLHRRRRRIINMCREKTVLLLTAGKGNSKAAKAKRRCSAQMQAMWAKNGGEIDIVEPHELECSQSSVPTKAVFFAENAGVGTVMITDPVFFPGDEEKAAKVRPPTLSPGETRAEGGWWQRLAKCDVSGTDVVLLTACAHDTVGYRIDKDDEKDTLNLRLLPTLELLPTKVGLVRCESIWGMQAVYIATQRGLLWVRMLSTLALAGPARVEEVCVAVADQVQVEMFWPPICAIVRSPSRLVPSS